MSKWYYSRRILSLIPHWFLLLLVVFTLSKLSPNDAVDAKLRLAGIENDSSQRYEEAYKRESEKLGLNLPAFYASIKAVKSGNNFFYPKVIWHGTQNQFHIWFKKLCTGDFGKSVISNKSVLSIIGGAALWTLPISFLSLLISVILAIVIAKRLSRIPNKIVEGILLVFYAIPIFWLASLILVFFTNDYYGMKIFDISPQYGRWDLGHTIGRALPMAICMIITDVAYIVSIYKTSIIEENKKPYFFTAVAKGLSEKETIDRHTSRNALITITTIIIGAIPAAFAGSVILESIFNVPGIGRVLFEAVKQGDYPILYIIVLLLGIFTSIFYLFGDLMLTKINPQIELESKKIMEQA